MLTTVSFIASPTITLLPYYSMFLSRSKQQNYKHRGLPSDKASQNRSAPDRAAQKRAAQSKAASSRLPPGKATSGRKALPKGQFVDLFSSEDKNPAEGKNRRGSEKVARLLLALGAEEAAVILKQLEPQEIENVMLQMSRINHITAEERQEILKEFELLLQEQKGRISGGLEQTRRFLEVSLGEERAKKLLSKLDQQNLYHSFAFLEGMEPSMSAAALAHEHAQVVAVALTFLKPKVAANIMNHLPEKFRMEVAIRIARTAEIHPEAVEQAARVLREKFERRQGADSYSTIGGARSLAGILNQMDRNSEEQILQTIKHKIPDIAEEVKNYLYSFEELANLTERDMRLLISQVDDNLQIAIALRGTTEQLRRHFFNAMSHNRAADIIEEMEARGPLPVREINNARSHILNLARLLDNEGNIVIKREKEDYV